MAKAGEIRGFYAVVDSAGPLARALVDAGACALQLRMKTAPTREILAAARRLRDEIRDVPFVVNDRVDVALAVGADAVHLGQTDLPLADARRLVGDRMRIGVSTHDLEQVRAAVAGGADYLGYGPVFATATKHDPDPVQGLDALRRAVDAAAGVPVVAIGGIDVVRAADVFAAGAAAVCAISAVNAAPDPAAAARAISQAR